MGRRRGGGGRALETRKKGAAGKREAMETAVDGRPPAGFIKRIGRRARCRFFRGQFFSARGLLRVCWSEPTLARAKQRFYRAPNPARLLVLLYFALPIPGPQGHPLFRWDEMLWRL